jgi:hypothetical protein
MKVSKIHVGLLAKPKRQIEKDTDCCKMLEILLKLD